MWSLGVVIWELCHPDSGVPYSDTAPNDAELVVAESFPPLWVPHGPRSRLAAIGASCCATDRAARPTVAEIAADLRGLQSSDWEVPRVLLTPIQTLGSGQSGTVTKMATTLFCEPGETVFVAVKELNEQSSSEAAAEFRAEIELMKRLQHPNLVSLLGVCTVEKPLYMVLEYLAGGSLESWLADNGPKLRQHELITIATQVSS